MLGIVLLIVGIIGLIKGTISVTGSKELRRPASIFVSLLFIAPFPLQIAVGVIMGVNAAANGAQDIKELESRANMIGLIIFAVCLVLGLVLAFALAKPKKVEKRRRTRDYDDEEDERPRRRRPVEDDEDEEERPRGRRRVSEDEEDERPRGKRDDFDDRAR